jgi:hypothetical protein
LICSRLANPFPVVQLISRTGTSFSRKMRSNISLNPDASPAALTRRPLGAG